MKRWPIPVGSLPAILTIAVALVAVAADDAPQPPATRPELSEHGAPATNPAACGKLRDRAIELLNELGPKLTADDEKAIQESIKDAQANGQRIADGWSAYAGGELLVGNVQAAAWAGLKALQIEWRPQFITNVGVYLYYLDRLDDAEAFLACARELDPRSPFVIEAQALLAMKRKQFDRAKELIELAVRLLPGDMNVRYSAGVIHHAAGDRAKAVHYFNEALRTKPDDPTVLAALQVVDPAAKSRQRDALDRLVDECNAFLDEMLARGEQASKLFNDIGSALHPGDWTENHGDFESMRGHIEDARKKIDATLKAARDTTFGPPDPFMWNQTASNCADAWAEAVQDYQMVFSNMSEILVMSSAYGADPVVFAGRVAPEYERDNMWVILDHLEGYEEAMKPVFDRNASCHDKADTRAEHDACDRQFCADAVPLWQAFRSAVDSNCKTAEASFPRAVEDYGNFWLAQVSRAAEFANRATKIFKPTPQAPDSPKQMAEGTANLVHVRLTGTIELMSIVLVDLDQQLATALESAPQEVMGFADAGPRGNFRLCPQDGSDPVGKDEQIDPFLEALKAATKFEYGWAIDCETKVGGFGFALKGKTFADVQITRSEKAGKLTVSGHVRGDGRFGGDISYSQSAGGGAHGVVGKGSVKVYARQRSGGGIDYGAQLEGKLGAGVNLKGVEVACYPLSGKVTFNARAFAAAL